MIAIIDYDMGNLRSVAKAFEKVGAAAVVTRERSVLGKASHVVLPGVGAFRECMRNLESYGLVDEIIKAINSGKPFLGICLGLQLLFDEGEEDGPAKGLGVIKGKVLRFPAGLLDASGGLKIPHMGWNGIKKKKDSPFLKDVPDGSFFYFVHSYHAVPDDPSVILASTDYGVEFTSAVEKNNVLACQFHPEKSQHLGLKILKNFKEMK
ncbi:MAG: imidazole glycerol phosphate synthase subunit HisH [Deltaproteobacteria bacterium]|nr:imidazole glycerol phosphate synthase subunit HisH [Deltaproteobacteria bacterium]